MLREREGDAEWEKEQAKWEIADRSLGMFQPAFSPILYVEWCNKEYLSANILLLNA